jgi:hypothetical protein
MKTKWFAYDVRRNKYAFLRNLSYQGAHVEKCFAS